MQNELMKKVSIIIILLIITGCKSNPKELIPFINGYWEISSVKQDNKIIKEYGISPIIDFWIINEDLTGFRKKVMPNLEGKIVVTQHSAPFIIKIEDNSLNIHYNEDDNMVDTIVKANENELVISDSQGLIYSYRPYEKIDLTDE